MHVNFKTVILLGNFSFGLIKFVNFSTTFFVQRPFNVFFYYFHKNAFLTFFLFSGSTFFYIYAAAVLKSVCQSLKATTSFKAVNCVQSSYSLAFTYRTELCRPRCQYRYSWHICTCAPFAQLGTCSLCSAGY